MLLPLELVGSGEFAIIEEVHGDTGLVGRLAELGLRHGCRLQVLQPGSPCMLQVGGCRLCLRSEEAMRIFVRPVVA